jgi:hypothetical protein
MPGLTITPSSLVPVLDLARDAGHQGTGLTARQVESEPPQARPCLVVLAVPSWQGWEGEGATCELDHHAPADPRRRRRGWPQDRGPHVARQAGGATARPAMEGHGWRIASWPPDPGPRRVRTASGTAGPMRARAVSVGERASQVTCLSALRPRTAQEAAPGFEPLIRTAAAVLWALANEASVAQPTVASSARLAAAQDHLAVALWPWLYRPLPAEASGGALLSLLSPCSATSG